MNDNWQDVFGNEVSAIDVVREAKDSNVTVADWLHSTYLAMFAENTAEMADNIDFEELGHQVIDEAMRSEEATEEAELWGDQNLDTDKYIPDDMILTPDGEDVPVADLDKYLG